ncbi:MAG: SUF system NifU family Fe-S cluster assembly protein [Balneolales bacterium]
MTSLQQIYSEVLVRHFKEPAHKGRLTNETLYETGYNPKCGDVINLSISCVDDGTIQEIMFDGKGCMICQASASILTRQVRNITSDEAKQLIHEVEKLFDKEHIGEIPLPDDVKALGSISRYPTRKQCVTLAWQTLGRALQRHYSR